MCLETILLATLDAVGKTNVNNLKHKNTLNNGEKYKEGKKTKKKEK